jgi:hypothetical protein
MASSIYSSGSKPSRSPSRFMIALLASVLIAAAPDTAGQADPPVQASTTEPMAENYYAFGDRLDVSVPVEGDVVVAGREVAIREMVWGDVLAAAWRLSFAGQTPDDVRVVGREVRLDASINGDLAAAGLDVIVGPQTHVTGRTWLTGQTVDVHGSFDRELRIAGGLVRLRGEMREPVTVIAEKLEVLSSARLLAPLRYQSPVPAMIESGATIGGPVAYEQISRDEARQSRSWVRMSSLLFAMHLLIAGLLLVLCTPHLPSAVVGIMREAPGRSLLAGGALLVTAPVIAAFLLISVIATPLGLVIGAAYLAALFVGIVVTAFYLGELEARVLNAERIATRGQRALVLLAGVVTLAILRSVPLLGTLVVFVSTLFGLGALAVWAYKLSSPLPAASTP